MGRTYLVVIILVVAVAALVVYAIEQNNGGSSSQPKTLVVGTVSSVQPNANFSLIFFENIRTGISYGTTVTANTTTSSTCTMVPPCVYRISLYPSGAYNATIQVVTRSGVRECPAVPSSFTPSGPRFSQNLVCEISYP